MKKQATTPKLLLALLAGAALGIGAHMMIRDNTGSLIPPVLEHHAQSALDMPHYNTLYEDNFEPSGFAGHYLAGFFAQRHHDWQSADELIELNLKHNPEDTALIKRAIMLAIGSGEYDKAFELAHQLGDMENDESISQIFLAVEALKKNDLGRTQTILDTMTKGGIADFIKPLMEGWITAANGNLNTDSLRKNSIHLSHAVLLAHYMKDNAKTEELLDQTLAMGGFTITDLQRSADLYAAIGKTDKALEVYEQVLKFDPSNSDARHNVVALQNNKPVQNGFKGIQSPQEGVALALYDMAKLFYQEDSDDSAHIFSHMALYLNPQHTETYILLAGIAARNERSEDAIAYYNTIDSDNAYYLEAQREIANILEDTDRTDEAIVILENMAKTHNDMNSLIQIGDIYRHQEDFPKAIKAYNHAYSEIGEDNILPEYWHIYYVRGMAYERNGQWDKAEADLQAALAAQPNHAYVLNYLGYAWADQGKNLDKAKSMIEEALRLQPQDGYITDSLGWILYRTGEYKKAVGYLEKAVELLPYDAVINDHLGDAYWRVGRKLEAKFQWERAKNHIDNDDKLLAQLEEKLENGLQKSAEPPILQAKIETGKTEEQKESPETVKDTEIAP